MRYLLDTEALLLAAKGALPAKIEKAIADPEIEVFYSAVSLWEIAIKVSIGKLKIPFSLEELARHLEHERIERVQLEPEHADAVAQLPFKKHRDHFDRLIAVQAKGLGAVIAGSDPSFEEYGLKRVWGPRSA